MVNTDPVRRYLSTTGCAHDVVEKGMEGLVNRWEEFAQSVKKGYPSGLNQYLNDMDVRQLISEAIEIASREQIEEFADRIRFADSLMKSSIVATPACLWGNNIAREEGWTPENNWWYFSKPINTSF